MENAIIDLCQGQFMDVSFVDIVSVAVEGYMDMVCGETAALFVAALRP